MQLTKPRVTLLNVIIGAAGLALAPVSVGLGTALMTLAGIALAVASANTLNMVIEKDSDGDMHRTADRPLPAGRLPAAPAAVFGAVLGMLSMLVLGLGVNPLTMALGAFALVAYAFIYTPLKRRTPQALIIGAIPGAMPPLMGWTAATGTLDAGGLAVFTILLVWQLPHFLAITLYLKNDYERGGIKTVAVVRGDRAAKIQAVAYATLLIPVSLLPVGTGLAGWLYLSAALALGVWFWFAGLKGLREGSGARWARKFFFASLIYLPTLFAVLVVDALI